MNTESELQSATGYGFEKLAGPKPAFFFDLFADVGIYVASAQLQLAKFHIIAPAFEADHIAIQYQAALNVHVRFGSRTVQSSIGGDTFFLVPRGVTSIWEGDGYVEPTLIFFQPQLFYLTLIQTFDREPLQAELLPRLAETDPLLIEVTRALKRDLHANSPINQLYLESLTQTLVVHLLHKHSVFPNALPRLPDRLRKDNLHVALDYIHDNLHAQLRLKEVAAVAAFSPYHFARLFKSIMGQSLHQYVMQQRLQEGMRLLQSGKHAVSEVAQKLGFADHSHFTNQFKRHFGVAPSEIARNGKSQIPLFKQPKDG